ncbi:MAG: hypothetical protein IT381_25075 [Deltaproteobacteria bacterium]|nr:hypothetical protein [Deltaproteobacteria bacterium]
MRYTFCLLLAASCTPPTPKTVVKEPLYDTAQSAALSATEPDRFFAAAFDDDNRLYAAGWVGQGGDQAMAVARFTAEGTLDASFGDGGVARMNVAVGGKNGEVARGIVIQSTGHVVIAGPFEHAPTAAGDAAKDTDVAAVRFTEDGALDTSFGNGGIARLDLSTGVMDGTTLVADTSWGLTLAADDRLLIVAARVADGRKDTDFALVRLTAGGALDTSFGTNGVVTVDVAAGVDSPRQAIVTSDGKVVACGYSKNAAGITSTVLFRVGTNGALDTSFGTSGVVSAAPLANVTEAYDVALVGGNLMTAGYGKNLAADKVDFLTAKFTADGAIVTSHGKGGVLTLDLAGDDDRGRDIVALPKGGALAVGSGKLTSDNVDAMIVKLTADGAFDPSFGEGGKKLYDLGGPSDSFFSVAVSPDGTRAAVAGYIGAPTAGPGNDDGVILFLDLR